MIRLLRLLALVSALAVIMTWAALGADRGWTKTSIAEVKIDPITEIEFTEYRQGFVPGVDFLAVGLAGSCVLFGLTFVLPKFIPQKNNTP